MGKKEEFKIFVKDHPKLLKHVNDGSMTWQKFYEMYDIYGDKEEVWKEYTNVIPVATAATAAATTAAASTIGFSDVLNWVKTIDLDSVQNGVNSLQRVVGVFQDFSKKGGTPTPKDTYKPRPMYKHFED